MNMLEPPVELLRAAALVNGSDYEERVTRENSCDVSSCGANSIDEMFQ